MKEMTSKLNDRVCRGEAKASQHINVLAHLDESTLIDKKGSLIHILQLTGIDFITRSDLMLDLYKNRRNTLLKTFSSEFALYSWIVRRKESEFPAAEFSEGFAKEVNERYKRNIEQKEMYHNSLYLAIVTKPAEGVINKGFHYFKQLNEKIDRETKEQYRKQRHHELQGMTQQVMQTLRDYHPRLLTVYCKNNKQYSQPLELLSELINFDKHSIPLDIENAAKFLSHKRLFFNRRSGTLEMRDGALTQKFAAMLSIKEYTSVSYQGIFDELSTQGCEYVITQSYRFYDRHVTKTKLREQQYDLLQSKDESISQTVQLNEALDEVAGGEVGYGLHHFTLICYADSQEMLNQHVGLLIALFSESDIIAVREDLVSECAFWSQLPGNFSYIARPAEISTKNLAAFATFHNEPRGHLTGNHWGDAVTVFETLSGSPYYFNFHYKDVGNFLVFGAMGSGKTVLVGFLILQSMKFGGKRIILDKDRGLEILVRAMGGVYERIKPGIATGFNPCQLDDTKSNRNFLAELFAKLLRPVDRMINEEEQKIIVDLIDGMYRLKKEDRQFCNIAPFFGTYRQGSLRARFEQWHGNGAHAWLFDNPRDSLHLSPSVIGFDVGQVLKSEACKTPALMYITYRIEEAIEGERGLLFADEGYQMLEDDYFREHMYNDWSRTPRKKNNIFGLATQDANDSVNENNSAALSESAFCKIFFPNPQADHKVYVEHLGLSEHEYQLIKSLPDDQHYFLLLHGRGSNQQSVVLRANLAGMEDVVSVISAREQSILLLDEIRAKVGDDPLVWLPLLHEQLKKGKLT